MPLEALLIPENLTDSDTDGIGGGQVVILYFGTVQCAPRYMIFDLTQCVAVVAYGWFLRSYKH